MSTLLPTRRDIIPQFFGFLLGIASNAASPQRYIFSVAVILFYLLLAVGLPTVLPGVLLKEMQNRIVDTRKWIADEATTATQICRREYWIYAKARGFQSVACIEERVKTLLAQHERDCTILNAFRYVKNLPRVLKEARKCQADLALLRLNLEDEVRHLNDDGGPGEYSYQMLVAP